MAKYKVIYADPAWHYNNRCQHSKTKFGGGATAQYPTMRDDEILGLAPLIDELADDDCALFMWATMPRLPLAIDVLKAWGFRYATSAFTWVKTTKSGAPVAGPGFYTASNVEVCLLGIRGRMTPVKKLVPSVILSPRREHSRKPDEARERIVEVYGDVPRIELFARQAVEGWDAIGNQLNGLDLREVARGAVDRPLVQPAG